MMAYVRVNNHQKQCIVVDVGIGPPLPNIGVIKEKFV
jgi:hypothetical protein